MKELAVKVFRKQEKLGYTAFMQGYMSQAWSVLQNVYDDAKDITDLQTDWMAKVIRSVWRYSREMWKARCDNIYGCGKNMTSSKRRKELLTLIEAELERTKLFGDFEIRQLRQNVIKSRQTANTQSLEIWLEMIRDVKESKIMRKRENQITSTRMQSITRFLCRPAPA